MNRQYMVFSLLSLFFLAILTSAPRVEKDSVGEVREEVRKGEILRYVILWSQMNLASREAILGNHTTGEQKETTVDQLLKTYFSGHLWIKARDNYEVKVDNITGEKVDYSIKMEASLTGASFPSISLTFPQEEKVGKMGPFHASQYLYIPPEQESGLKPPSNKEVEKFISFFPPRLPFFWLRIPPMKKGEEIQIEWEPFPYKLLGIKPPLATVQFLGIYTKNGRKVALYKVKRTTSYFRGTFRLYYDLQLKKFVEMDGTFEFEKEATTATMKGKEKEENPQFGEIKVHMRNYLLF